MIMSEALLFQLICSIYFVVGFWILLNKGFYNKIFKHISDSPIFLYFGGITSFTIGFILVSFYNTWSLEIPVILTIFWWAALLKWIWIIVFPDSFTKLTGKMLGCPKLLPVLWVITVLIWIALSYIWSFIVAM